MEENDLDNVSMTNAAVAQDQIEDEDKGSFVELIRYFNQLDIDMRELS